MDGIGGDLNRTDVTALVHSFKVGPSGTQEMLVAEEHRDVVANRIECFKVRQVEVPKRSMVFPSLWARHPLDFVGEPSKQDRRRA